MSDPELETDVDALNRIVSNAAYEESGFTFMADDDDAEGLYADMPGASGGAAAGEGQGGYLDIAESEDPAENSYFDVAPKENTYFDVAPPGPATATSNVRKSSAGGVTGGSSYYDVVGSKAPNSMTAFGKRREEGRRTADRWGTRHTTTRRSVVAVFPPTLFLFCFLFSFWAVPFDRL